jgi:hypothetical protein
MLDEWRTNEGIQVVDGWSFQVSFSWLFVAFTLNVFGYIKQFSSECASDA